MFNFFMPRNRGRRNCRCLTYKLLSYEIVRDIIWEKCVPNSKAILIDVRDKREYEKMHVVNAVNIPLANLVLCENEYKGKEIIILYCATGYRTKEAIRILNNLGYTNLYIWEYGALGNFPYTDMIKYN